MTNQLAVEAEETMDTRPCKVEKFYPDDLVERYHRMIVHLVNKYAHSPFCPFEDLYNEAVIALYEAYRRWDPARSTFTTLAYKYISRRLKDYVRGFYRFYLSDSPEARGNGRQVLLESELEGDDQPFSLENHPEDDPLDGFSEDVARVLRDCLPVIGRFLPERSWKVLRLYYGLDGISKDSAEIARELGVTRQRVIQLKNEALERVISILEALDEH